jgi:hypothetical protein
MPDAMQEGMKLYTKIKKLRNRNVNQEKAARGAPAASSVSVDFCRQYRLLPENYIKSIEL